jgi:hypothetical protein
VEVTSNIWGTKFKIHGLASYLTEDLGEIVYKTSLLHLQPRQMTISIMELSCDELRPHKRDPSYNPNHFSESEDEALLCKSGFFEWLAFTCSILLSVPAQSANKFSAHLASLQLPSHNSSNYASISPETASAAVPGLVEVHSSFKAAAKVESVPTVDLVSSPPHCVEGAYPEAAVTVDAAPALDAAAAYPEQQETLSTTSVMYLVAQRLQEDAASLHSSSSSSSQSRWAERPCTDFKYIDEDLDEAAPALVCPSSEVLAPSESPLSELSSVFASSLSLSSSKNTNSVPSTVSSPSDSSGRISSNGNIGGGSSSVVLVAQVSSVQAFEPQNKHIVNGSEPKVKSKLKDKVKSNRCIEIARTERTIGIEQVESSSNATNSSTRSSSPKKSFFGARRGSLESRQLKKDSGSSQSTSLPASPSRSYLKKQCSELFRWPSFTRNKSQSQAASDDELAQDANVTTSDNFKNLQTFQKAQMNRKVN